MSRRRKYCSAQPYLDYIGVSERERKECADEFEAPIWAHGRMRKMGLNPLSMEDWSFFKEYCE